MKLNDVLRKSDTNIGDPYPLPEDFELTDEAKRAYELIQIRTPVTFITGRAGTRMTAITIKEQITLTTTNEHTEELNSIEFEKINQPIVTYTSNRTGKIAEEITIIIPTTRPLANPTLH